MTTATALSRMTVAYKTFFCVASERRIDVRDLVKTTEGGVSAPICTEKPERKSNTSKLKATSRTQKENGDVYRRFAVYCAVVWCGVAMVWSSGMASVWDGRMCSGIWLEWCGAARRTAIAEGSRFRTRKMKVVMERETSACFRLVTAAKVRFPENGYAMFVIAQKSRRVSLHDPGEGKCRKTFVIVAIIFAVREWV